MISDPAMTQLRAEIKEWSDIAYEMWAVLCNSTNDGHSTSDEWYAARDRLRDRFHAALDTLPSADRLVACDHPYGTGTICDVCGGDVAALARLAAENTEAS